MRKSTSGFTIVELLIVIVVIGILAAIVIVAYNGVQARATFAQLQGQLNSINKTLKVYHAEYGSYPVTGTTAAPNWRYSCSTGIPNFIASINSYSTAALPQAPCNGGAVNNDTWLYASDGAGYKLLHIRPNASIASSVPVELRDTRYSAAQPTWGYWTTDWTSI